MISVWDLVAYVRAAVGGGYVWGAGGETCSLSFREKKAEQYPAQSKNILGICKKWDGLKVWDCAGLIRAAFRELGILKATGATTIWKTWAFLETGTIDTLPDEPGIALFFAASPAAKTMNHIGVTVGSGMAVDAKGSNSGVVLKPVAGHKWTHWARFADVDYSLPEPKPESVKPASPADAHTTLRYTSGMKLQRDSDVLLAQNTLVSRGYSFGSIDGIYGPKTKAAVLAFQMDAFPAKPKEWDGVVGPKTWTKLLDK